MWRSSRRAVPLPGPSPGSPHNPALCIMHPAALVRRVGKDVAERPPEPEGSVADGKDRGSHAPSFEVTQHVGPGLGGLAVPVGDRDQFLGPISPDTDDDQDTEAGFFEADVEVDPVGVHVDVVDVFERRGARTGPVSRCQSGASRVITEAESPAADPKNSSSAGTKSPELMSVEVHAGEAPRPPWATCGPTAAGSSCENACAPRSPSSTRRSSTRGARTSIGPAPVTIDVARHARCARPGDGRPRRARGSASRRSPPPRLRGLRPTSASPPRPPARPAHSTSSSSAAASTCTLNIGVPSCQRLTAGVLVLCQTGRYAAPPVRWCIHSFGYNSG